MSEENTNTVQAAKRALHILGAIHELSGASPTEIAEYLDYSRTSVYKYINTLEEERYIVRDEENNYQVGLKPLSLGVAARRRREVYEAAKPQIESLAEQSKETANLLVEEHGQGFFLYRSNSQHPVNLGVNAGQEVYLHATATGKVILANLPRKCVDEILDHHGLPKMTEETITCEDVLFNELREIRERGWAYDDEEYRTGLRCVGVAILDAEERVIGAISISGASSRLESSRFTEEVPEILFNAKNIIELNVAYN